MTQRTLRRSALLWCVLCIGSTHASAQQSQDARSEDAMFGAAPESAAPPSSAPQSPAPVVPALDPAQDRDASELTTANPERDLFASGEATDNPLQIGGTYYQRLIVSGQEGKSLSSTPMTMPLQFNGYFDARPSDRLRGFLDLRLMYDPTRDAFSNTTRGGSTASLQTASTSSTSSTSAAPTTLGGGPSQVPNNPQTVLNEAWLKFDIARTLFVTAGRQHIKWGAARFWNPTDFLNPQRRDPLMPYDLRLGSTMLKVALPIEGTQTAFYAVALFDNPLAASTLGQLGAAVRAETVLGDAELGVDAVWRRGSAPLVGADLSMPIGPLDAYVEASCLLGRSAPVYALTAPLRAGNDVSKLLRSSTLQPGAVQVATGANYVFAWTDNRQATLGVEYFFNQLGYKDPSIYPVLIFLGKYQPFYTGQQYAALYFTAEGPDAEKHTSYTVSTLANVSDRSLISRVDFSWRFLTYLTFAAYADAHYGASGGEFNFSLHTPALTFNGGPIPEIVLPPTRFDVGVSLRMSF